MKVLAIIKTESFFFQAEDGIRDSSVTGVQTCALPILCWSCWITGSPSRDTARYFSTACRITDSPPNWKMWRSFSMFEVTIEETFAAGHALRNYRGKCENVHGHNYRCQVTLEGEQLDSIGLLVDFVEMKRVVHSVLDRMDHQWLNEVPPFDLLNPSAENMAKYIHDEVKQGLRIREGVRIGAVKLSDTDTSTRTYRERSRPTGTARHDRPP